MAAGKAAGETEPAGKVSPIGLQIIKLLQFSEGPSWAYFLGLQTMHVRDFKNQAKSAVT